MRHGAGDSNSPGLDRPNSVRLLLDKAKKVTVEVPRIVTSHSEFSAAVLKIRRRLVGKGNPSSEFIPSMYYLLGWFVGDAGKHFGSEKLMSARVNLALSRKHPENLALGEYMMSCISDLGVQCVRMRDGQPRENNPNGYYWWMSRYSPVVGWIHCACLGLGWRERTTRNPVKMKWLMKAPQEFRIQFLRGLADSDGMVHFGSKEVNITTQPNTRLVAALFQSLGIHARIGTTNGCGMVTISCTAAAEIKVFNPEVMTHRRRILERLADATTFQRRWPHWLEAKVENLLSQNLGIREICERLLEEDNVYVKYNTLRRKRRWVL